MNDLTNTSGGQNSHGIQRPKRDEHLSPDGLWRSYPKVPNLICYVKSGVFYGRVKVNGKPIRRSLDTTVFTTARLRLGDYVKKHRTRKAVLGTFSQARELYERDLESSHEIGDNSKRYRRYCIRQLLDSWPYLDATLLEKISKSDCKAWAAKLSQTIDETYFNNILGTLRAILKIGGLVENPASEVKRLGVKNTALHLPEPDQFNKILELVGTAGARQSRDCANLIRFLAFSGCRISEARAVTWADVDFQRRIINVRNAKIRRSKNGSEWRQVPIIPDMAALFSTLNGSTSLPSEKVCAVGECEKSLTRACRLAGIARITHHDLRHLFATRCIESGVDIPTVSRWLGHSDGGALAMRVYGHLRTSHSVEMAQRVNFSNPTKVQELATHA